MGCVLEEQKPFLTCAKSVGCISYFGQPLASGRKEPCSSDLLCLGCDGKAQALALTKSKHIPSSGGYGADISMGRVDVPSLIT